MAETTPVQRNRLTVVETIYHWLRDGQPIFVQQGWNRLLDSDEDGYKRRVVVKQEWQQLDLGWLKSKPLSAVYLANEREQQAVNPSPEEQAAIEAKVVEVGFAESGIHAAFQIRPGESMRACPIDADRLYLRSRAGIARINILAIPE
jgi:hypothetical protein